MKSFIHLTVPLALILTLFSCGVSFNEELREYVDNIVARSPLDFSLSGSEIIDGYDSINMGYIVVDSNSDYTIINNENIDIKLAAFGGVSGDFTIAAFEAFTLGIGESHTFNIGFDLNDTNFDKRVFKEINFADIDGREYTFHLWATSKTQPLAMYNTDGEEITEFDLGAWSDNRTHTIILKNEGLDSLVVNSVSFPYQISFSGENSFSMEINEEREINLVYVTGSVEDDITFNTDNVRESEFLFSISAGGELPVDILDSGLVALSGDLYIGEYISGDPISLTFFLDNISLSDMDIEVSFNSDMFITELINTPLTVDDNVQFHVSFFPPPDTSAGIKTADIQLMDLFTGRSLTITLTGLYSPI